MDIHSNFIITVVVVIPIVPTKLLTLLLYSLV